MIRNVTDFYWLSKTNGKKISSEAKFMFEQDNFNRIETVYSDKYYTSLRSLRNDFVKIHKTRTIPKTVKIDTISIEEYS